MAVDATAGGSSADSYVTLAEYQAYAASYGWTLSGVDATDEVNLRIARKYLDTTYTWIGEKASSTQSLDWPRITGQYIEGYAISASVLPQPIKDAQMEMAFLVQGGATPFATLSTGAVERKREKVDVIEEDTTYRSARERAAYPVVDGLVAEYAVYKRGSAAGSVPLARA